MRRYLLMFIVISSLLLGVRCFGFAEVMKVITAEGDLSKLVFLENGHHILGIDYETYQQKLDLEFDTYVTFGDLSSDNRIFVADDGERLGVWGEQLFIIDQEMDLIHKLRVFPNSRTIKVIADRLIVGNSSYTAEAYAGLQIFDISTYQLLYESKEVGNIISKRNIQQFNNTVYIGVPAFAAQNRGSYLLKINLQTLEVQKVYKYTNDHKFERFDILIEGQRLIVIFHDSRQIRVYDLCTDQLIQSIELNDFVDIPDAGVELNYWFSEPVRIGDDLIVIVTDNLPAIVYQKVLILDNSTFQFKKVVDLASEYNLRFFSLKYVHDNQLWIEDGGFIGVYDYQSGQLLQRFTL